MSASQLDDREKRGEVMNYDGNTSFGSADGTMVKGGNGKEAFQEYDEHRRYSKSQSVHNAERLTKTKKRKAQDCEDDDDDDDDGGDDERDNQNAKQLQRVSREESVLHQDAAVNRKAVSSHSSHSSHANPRDGTSRSSSRMSEPRSLDELKLSGKGLRTEKGEKFFLRDSDGVEGRIMCFATKKNLKTLGKVEWWYMDGTMHSVPPLISQIFVIHGGIHGKHVPLVYALIEEKTSATFHRLLEILQEECSALGIVLSPQFIWTGFDTALLAPIRDHFPGAVHKGCHFQMVHAVLTKLDDLGLQFEYQSNSEFKQYVRKAIALGFLPSEQVFDGFETLQSSVPSGVDCVKFNSYFHDTWLQGVFPLEKWNYWSLSTPKANIHLEAWDTSWNYLIGANHPELLPLVGMIKRLQSTTEEVVDRMCIASKRGRTGYVQAKEKRIRRLFTQYAWGELTQKQYLLKCSDNIDTVELHYKQRQFT